MKKPNPTLFWIGIIVILIMTAVAIFGGGPPNIWTMIFAVLGISAILMSRYRP